MNIETVEEDLMKEVASEMRLPYKTVRDIVINGQNAFVASVISSGSFNSVRMPFLGTFKIRPKYALVSEQMKQLDPISREILKQRIQNGSVFERHYEKIQEDNGTIQD